MRFITFYQSTLCLGIWLMLQTMGRVTGQVSGEEHRQFADSLTHELYVNDNECTSSWGISMLFDLLRPGASGDTTNQICDILSLCGPRDTLLWNDTITALTMANNGECSLFDDGGCYEVLPLIKVANSIWIDISRELQSGYSEIVGEYLQLTDFASEDAGGTINSWVNTSTLGLIDSIIDTGPIFHDLIAINSIYLKAYWQQQFSEARTNEDFFYKDASREEMLPGKAHFMHTFRFLPYSHEVLPGYQIVSLEYRSAPDDNLSMVLVLPLVAGAASVSSNDVVDVLPLPTVLDASETRPFGRGVALAIPKFRIESNYETDLEDSLTSLGLTAPFDLRHGFCGLIDECLYIDRLIHKTYIEVNEEGTTAAAVTLAMLAGSALPSGPVLFLADHPFQFFIYDAKEDLILFEGRVGAPAISEDWSPAQFQAVHSDPDFWTSNFGLESPPVQPEPSITNPSSTQPPPARTTQPGSMRDDDSDSPAERFVTAHWTTYTAAFITAFIGTF